jgi:TPR repeat protein
VLRWTAWAFIAATVYLNIAAAHGNPTAVVMHAAMPVLFITVIEGIRHLIRQLTGLATGTRIEHIPVSRWLLAPRSTLALDRCMVLWHVTSYHDGLRLEHQRLLAIGRLQQAYGRWLWRCRAPLRDRLALRLTPLEIINEIEPPKPTAAPISAADKRLLEAAAAILRDAHRQGNAISQSALAKRLRASGHSIANDRLAWLIRTAQSDASLSEAA